MYLSVFVRCRRGWRRRSLSAMVCSSLCKWPRFRRCRCWRSSSCFCLCTCRIWCNWPKCRVFLLSCTVRMWIRVRRVVLGEMWWGYRRRDRINRACHKIAASIRSYWFRYILYWRIVDFVQFFCLFSNFFWCDVSGLPPVQLPAEKNYMFVQVV